MIMNLFRCSPKGKDYADAFARCCEFEAPGPRHTHCCSHHRTRMLRYLHHQRSYPSSRLRMSLNAA